MWKREVLFRLMRGVPSFSAAVVVVAAFTAACGSREKSVHPVPREEAVAIAKEAASAAFQKLSGELGTAIAAGGPVAAIEVCSQKAGGLLENEAAARNVGLVRISDRPRNPAHAAGPDDLAAMETFRAALESGAQPEPAFLARSDGSAIVHLPILVHLPLCLQCHGGPSDIAAGTREALARLYPEDRATGYKLGDLRGAWRVTLPPR